MKKLLFLVLTISSFSAFTQENNCNLGDAKFLLKQAAESIQEVRQVNSGREAQSLLEEARINMCAAVRSCPDRKAELNSEMLNPCSQKPVYLQSQDYDIRVEVSDYMTRVLRGLSVLK
jgi:hypothetical protein